MGRRRAGMGIQPRPPYAEESPPHQALPISPPMRCPFACRFPFNFSPAKIDTFVNSVTGGLYRQMTDVPEQIILGKDVEWFEVRRLYFQVKETASRS